MKAVVVASSSGGHVCPALAFCQGLREREGGAAITFVTTDGEIERTLLGSAFPALYYRRERLTVFSAHKLIALFWQARKLFLRLQPDLVAGFGGSLSIPFILAARFHSIPCFIHEQNMTLGRANRLLTLFADKIILSFPPAKGAAAPKAKTLVIGLPLRKGFQKIDKRQARHYFGFNDQDFVLLVAGGSQGSTRINAEAVKALQAVDGAGIGVIHSTGFFDYEHILREYKDIKMHKHIAPFIERMDYAMSACDLMIARAGAGTIAEIAFMKTPAVLIPYPHAQQHQLDNARFLSDNNAALLMEEQGFDASVLKEKIIAVINNRRALAELSSALAAIPGSGARERLAAFAYELTQLKGDRL